MFADLECATGRVVKDIEMALDQKDVKSDSAACVHLKEGEVHTVYKFLVLSGLRNRPGGLYLDDKLHHPALELQDRERKGWVDRLAYLLKSSHQDLVKRNDLLEPIAFRPILARYKQLAKMKLFFWAVPDGEEFLRSIFMVGLEGCQASRGDGALCEMRMPAHLFLPVNPRVIMVLCNESLCKISMLCNIRHEPTTPYDRPPKGKPSKTTGPKKYQSIVPNWKTSYHITSIRSRTYIPSIPSFLVFPQSLYSSLYLHSIKPSTIFYHFQRSMTSGVHNFNNHQHTGSAQQKEQL